MSATNEAAIGALRLAIEAAADAETTLAMVSWIVDQVPQTPAQETASVALLVEGVRALNGRDRGGGVRSPLLAHAYMLVRGGMLPRDAACEAWNDAGLHGDNRDRFIEEVELAAAAGGLATSTTGGNDGD